MIGAQQDEGEAFVVAQQHVVGRAVTLDQLRLEQQRLGLAIGGDNRHAARQRDHPPQPVGQPVNLRVIGDPVLERPRLAHIEHIAARIVHPVHAGLWPAASSSTLRIAATPPSRSGWSAPRTA